MITLSSEWLQLTQPYTGPMRVSNSNSMRQDYYLTSLRMLCLPPPLGHLPQLPDHNPTAFHNLHPQSCTSKPIDPRQRLYHRASADSIQHMNSNKCRQTTSAKFPTPKYQFCKPLLPLGATGSSIANQRPGVAFRIASRGKHTPQRCAPWSSIEATTVGLGLRFWHHDNRKTTTWNKDRPRLAHILSEIHSP